MRISVRPATKADLPCIYEVRHGTAENRLTDPSLVTDAEVAWYLDEAIFLVSEDEAGVQGFACANHQTGYVWALFVIDEAQGRGHGAALLDEAIRKLRQAGHRQAFLTTGRETKAAAFYRSKGWRRPVNRYLCRLIFNGLSFESWWHSATIATPSQQRRSI